jgi:alkylated DNA repair dioxygenase AlkB
MTSTQRSLFVSDLFPAGFRYREDVISPDKEQRLITSIEELPFREFEFRGFLGKRRTISFGWKYDFTAQQLQEAEQIPLFLVALQEQVAEFAGVEAGLLEHILVTEYPPGAGIGWHRDRNGIRGCDWALAWIPLPVPLPSQEWLTLGAGLD